MGECQSTCSIGIEADDRIKYFLSLVLEGYENVGDKKELLEMAEVTEAEVKAFLS